MKWVKICLIGTVVFALFVLVPSLVEMFSLSYEWWVKICTDYCEVFVWMVQAIVLFIVVIVLYMIYVHNEKEMCEIENADVAMRRDAKSATSYVECDKSWSENTVDELGRKPYSDFVSKLIVNLDVSSSGCIGLYGKWGEGKSFVWKMIQAQVKEECDEIEFVEFSPWQSGRREDWACLLFSRIAEVLSTHGCSDSILAMRTYGRSLGLKPEIGLFGGIPWIGLWIENRISELYDSYNLHRHAVETLRSFGRTIVVVIDDLDRLEYDDVCEIVRIIKTNGDLPHVLYVLLADEGHLVKALGEKFGGESEGRNYLEKIVQYACPLPAVPEADLTMLYIKRIEQFLSKRFDIKLIEEERIRLNMLSGLFRCMRDVIRAYDQYVIDCEFHITKGEAKGLSVDFVDLAGLSAVKALENCLYENLRSIYFELLAIEDFVESSKKYDENWLETCVLSRVSEARRGAVKVFLKWYMGLESVRVMAPDSDPVLHYRLNTSDNTVALANHSLMSAYCFDDYFTSKYCQNSVPSGDQQEFLSLSCYNPEEALSSAKQIAIDGRFAYLAQILCDYNAPSSGAQLVSYVTTLMRMADEVWPQDQIKVPSNFERHSTADVYDKISCAIDKSLSGKGYSSIVLLPEYQDALRISKGFVVGLLLMNRWWSKDFGYSFYAERGKLIKGFEEVIRIVLMNVSIAAENGKLFKHPHVKDLIEDWAKLICHCNDVECREVFCKYYQQISGLNIVVHVRVLQSCSDPCWGVLGNTRSNTIDFDRYFATLGSELVTMAMEQLKKMKQENQLDDKSKMLLSCLEFAYDRKIKNLSYNQKNQIEDVYGVHMS